MNIILAYIFYFVAASASPLQRRWLAKKKDIDGKGQIHFAFQSSVVIALCSLFLPLLSPFYIAGNLWYITGLGLLGGMFGAVSVILMYKAQKHIEAGLATLLGNIYTPISIVLAWILLSEKLLPIQILGTIILFMGMVIVSNKHRIGRFKFDKYFWLIILSGISTGLLVVIERMLQKATGLSAGLMMNLWSQCLFLCIIFLFSKSRSTYAKKDIAITGGLRFLQILSWAMLTFVVGNLSVVSSVTTFKVVIMFVAGAIILHEREDFKRKLLGSIIAIIGLLLMK